MNHKFRILLCIVLFFGSTTTVFSAEKWTLEKAFSRAMEISPEFNASLKDIEIAQEKVNRVDLWPNPSVEAQMSNKLGLYDGKDGINITQVSFQQSIPVLQTEQKKKVAMENLAIANIESDWVKIQLKFELAKEFYVLQLKKSHYELAKAKQELIETHLKFKNKQNLAVQFLTPLDKARLEIAKSYALVNVENEECHYQEALTHFKSMLKIPTEQTIELPELNLHPNIPNLKRLQLSQNDHPILKILEHKISLSESRAKLFEKQKFTNPEIQAFVENDVLTIKRQKFFGVALAISPPLWNQNQSKIKTQTLEAEKHTQTLTATKREMQAKLTNSFNHLTHLIELLESYHTSLIPQTKQFLDLNIKSFSVGESNILVLNDAYDSHFKVQAEYLNTLKEAWFEWINIQYLSNAFNEKGVEKRR